MNHRGTVGAGDGVLRDGRNIAMLDPNIPVCAAQVWALCSVNGEPLALVATWEVLVSASSRTGSAKWVEEDRPELWPLHQILTTLTYRRYSDGVVTLVPPAYRHLLGI